MAGLSPKLPMRRSFQDGYLMNQTLKEVIQQNLKGLLLTSPGERVKDPLFGVGLRDFLFEQNIEFNFFLIFSCISFYFFSFNFLALIYSNYFPLNLSFSTGDPDPEKLSGCFLG